MSVAPMGAGGSSTHKIEFLRCAEGATKILHFLDVLVEFTVLFNASGVGASKNSNSHWEVWPPK